MKYEMHAICTRIVDTVPDSMPHRRALLALAVLISEHPTKLYNYGLHAETVETVIARACK